MQPKKLPVGAKVPENESRMLRRIESKLDFLLSAQVKTMSRRPADVEQAAMGDTPNARVEYSRTLLEDWLAEQQDENAEKG